MKIGEYSPRPSQDDYSPMLTEPEVNNCFSIIFRDEYQGLQKNGLKHTNTEAKFVCLHTGTQLLFN